MLVSELHHILALPGLIILFLSGLNFYRYIMWNQILATIIDIKIMRGEYTHNRVVVKFIVGEREYISELGEDFSLTKIDAKRNDTVKILYNPSSPSKCIAYNPQDNVLIIILALIMILI
jgi:hypothetical protein